MRLHQNIEADSHVSNVFMETHGTPAIFPGATTSTRNVEDCEGTYRFLRFSGTVMISIINMEYATDTKLYHD